MGMILETRAEPEFLYAEVAGDFSLEEAERTFREILEAVVRHRVKKVLFDGRKLIGNPTTMERFYYGAFVAKSVARLGDRDVSPAAQFAYVLTEPVLDPRRFGEAPTKEPDAGDG